MSEIKFQNYSGIKNEQHNPRAVAKTVLKNGYAVLNVTESGKEVARVVANATEAKGNLYFVCNTIDKPELDNKSDFVVNTGEFAKIFKFPKDELLEVTGDLVDGAVVVGDVLIADATAGKLGLYRKALVGDTAYAVALEVLEVTTFGGKGYTVKVVSIA